jgi:hypothetical protein
MILLRHCDKRFRYRPSDSLSQWRDDEKLCIIAKRKLQNGGFSISEARNFQFAFCNLQFPH